MAFFSDESKRKYIHTSYIRHASYCPHKPMLIIAPLSLYHHLPQVE